MIYNYCNHTEGKCPCLTCAERDCPSCDGTGRESMAWTLTACAPGQKPIARVEGVSSVTVKDLKAKLSNIPEEASVEIVMCANDNPLSDGCRVNSVCYFEWLQKDGGKTVVLFPE